jgi:tetraacyldisaccharide 4'-kinase
LERFIAGILYDRCTGPAIRIFAAVLHLLSFPFRAIVTLRLLCYRLRIMRPQYLGCTVIAVGNLTVGGTGKTPIVELLARELTKRGRRVAVLSRGYRSKSSSRLLRLLRSISHGNEPPPRIVSDGKQLLLNSEIAGDEPYMLAKNLPGVVVLTDKNRVKAGNYAVNKFHCDTLLLDDGFQYLHLLGQHNLLLIDSGNPIGNGYLLPRGILREPPAAMGRATHIFITKVDGEVGQQVYELLNRHGVAEVPLTECRHEPKILIDIQEGSPVPIGEIARKRVGIFCGIAVPESFEAFIRRSGATIVLRRYFPDHYRFSMDDVERIFERACEQGAEMVLTTEKDAVRLQPQWIYPLPTYYLRIEIDILRGRENFEALLDHICGKISAASAVVPPLQ